MRYGDWIQTYTGKKMYPLDPLPEEICIADIAHALSYINRYTGHARFGISVAQHSALVAKLLPKKLQLAGLLHDAAEAYLGDVSRPVKKTTYFLVNGQYIHFSLIEERLLRVIFSALNVGWPSDEDWLLIHQADNRLLATEARDLMSPLQEDWKAWLTGLTPLPDSISNVSPECAKNYFMHYYEKFQS